MPRLSKHILTEGTYLVNTPSGTRISQEWSPEKINRTIDTSRQMLKAGLKIPSPYAHKKDAKPKTDDEVKVYENQPAKPYDNAGYWQDFYSKINGEGKLELWGDVEAPGSEEDKDSHYYKLKNTNDEVSLSASSNWTDGLGRVWKDGILHVAIVNHAVVPNQKPFEDTNTIVNLSMVEENPVLDGNISNLLNLLRTKCGINLPATTNGGNLIDFLTVAVGQLPDHGAGGTTTLEPAPIYMSTGDEVMELSQAQAIVEKGVINPGTSKPFTLEDLGFKQEPPKKDPTPGGQDLDTLMSSLEEEKKQNKSLSAILKGMQNKIIADTKKHIQERISALIERGAVTAEYAKQNLEPKVEFQMSLQSDGTFADHPLEVVLSTIEETVPATQKPNNHMPAGGTIVLPPAADEGELTDEQLKEASKYFQENYA